MFATCLQKQMMKDIPFSWYFSKIQLYRHDRADLKSHKEIIWRQTPNSLEGFSIKKKKLVSDDWQFSFDVALCHLKPKTIRSRGYFYIGNKKQRVRDTEHYM